EGALRAGPDHRSLPTRRGQVAPDPPAAVLQRGPVGAGRAPPTSLGRRRSRLGPTTGRPGLAVPIRRVRLTPNRRMLALLEERLPADLVVTDPADDRIVALDRAPIEFLAGNQWMFANAYWDSLAAFVQPNSPAIDQVLEATRQLPK